MHDSSWLPPIRTGAGLLLLSLTLLAPLALGCAHRAARPSAVSRPVDTAARSSIAAHPAETPATSTVERLLRREIDRWRGTPYCHGGRTELCADCSGFVQTIFARVLRLQLPRDTTGMASCGREVEPEELRAGDLVFFRIPGKSRHVGIYLREGEFAHASSSSGVRTSNLHEQYWRKAFRTARRVE